MWQYMLCISKLQALLHYHYYQTLINTHKRSQSKNKVDLDISLILTIINNYTYRWINVLLIYCHLFILQINPAKDIFLYRKWSLTFIHPPTTKRNSSRTPLVITFTVTLYFFFPERKSYYVLLCNLCLVSTLFFMRWFLFGCPTILHSSTSMTLRID